MKTRIVRIAALLLCTVMAPAVTSAAWAQTTSTATQETSGASADAATIQDALSNAESTEALAAGSIGTVLDTGTGATAPANIGGDKPKYYDDYGNPYNTYDYYEVQPNYVLIALQRDPRLPNDHFVLSMIVGNSFTSCAKVLNPKHSTEFMNDTMVVKVDKFSIDTRDMPKYAHYECNNAPQQPIANVSLSKQLLQDNGVKKIKFKTDKASVTYNVKMTDEYVQLVSDSRIAPDRLRFQPLWVDGVSNTLKYWFYPENTVILSMDGASKDLALESSLKELARSKGLTPLDDMFPDHKHYRKKANMYYFVDKEGRYKNVSNELFDYVQADAMKYGLEADEPIKKNVAVFIRKPGQYE